MGLDFRSRLRPRGRGFLLAVPACLCLLAVALPARAADSGDSCLTCHREKTPGLVLQWEHSRHARNQVTCIECHGREAAAPGAFSHYGAVIATLVTPKDCGNCHGQQMEEFERSHHSKAGQILDSADNYLAGVIAGYPAVVTGCESCHGGRIALDPQSPNRLARLGFPNSGIGRINPDGSMGSCSACHARHDFSRAQARQPENCGKCHLGPDHPQREIYEESKHGIAFADNRDSLHLEADSWIVGRDYYLAPTCATCHLSAAANLPATHDPGERISWTLRPAVSRKQVSWPEKRGRMQGVCTACHSLNFVQGHYVQYDGLVNLYNEKFAVPAGAVMEILKKNGSLKRSATFGNDVEWIYWELWHHEGRRGRMGASMMGPDYTWWHGLYEVAKHFYFEFLPAVRETGDAEAIAYLDRLTGEDPMHRWFVQTKEENKKALNSGELERLYRKFFLPPP
jgi:hydroxylamine dehydrogenase